MNDDMTDGNSWWNRKRVLVTGSSGFIGSHLTERLLQMGAIVGGLSRTYGKLAEIGPSDNLNVLACDLTDAEHSESVMGEFRPEIMIHLAAQPDGPEGLQQAHLAIRNNILGTANALEAFRRAGGRVVVYGDSCKVYGNSEVPYREATGLNPGSSYSVSKMTGWSYCRLYHSLYGLAAVAIRPTLIYGPRQPYNLFSFLVDAVLSGREEIPLDGGSQTRDPLYIDDAVEVYLTAARHGDELAGEVLNIGGGHECTVEELARRVVEVMRGRQRIVPVESRARPTEIWRSYCDNREALARLGWSPKTPLEQGLRKTVDYQMRHRAAASP